MSIERLENPGAAAAWCERARAAGLSLGFVPTMGALHEGHLSLVERAVRENDRAVVSVFVNPLQFDDPGDLAAYPCDRNADASLLDAGRCAMVFTGTLEEFFPETGQGPGQPRRVDPGPAARGLEGASRQGHFEGVATIVARFFELVKPARAYFGAKDYQQTLVVRHVARLLDGPEIVVCPTSRESDGLARSSRNLRLTHEDRGRAVALYRALTRARDAWSDGERDAQVLQATLRAALDVDGLEVDYAELRDPRAWTAASPRGEMTQARALVAARLGEVRLLDNMALDEDGE